jgi:hypothetical protein
MRERNAPLEIEHHPRTMAKPPPMISRVIGSLPILLVAVAVYLVARCAGWNPPEIK